MSDALDPTHGPYRALPKDPTLIARDVANGLVMSYVNHRNLDRLRDEIAEELQAAVRAGRTGTKGL